MRRLLRVCQKIESQVSSLNRLEQENNRLTTSLNQVEANFHLLLRTSQAEISKLKSALLHNSKRLADGFFPFVFLLAVFLCSGFLISYPFGLFEITLLVYRKLY